MKNFATLERQPLSDSAIGGEGGEAFLGVCSSITGRCWGDRLDAAQVRLALAIAQRHDLPDLLGRILAGRGVTPENCLDFLTPSLRSALPDPLVLRDMDIAAARLAQAVQQGETIAIFGDYDVDGATSSALLSRFLRMVGAVVGMIYIPDRLTEGYGPNKEAFKELVAKGAGLIICVDCGSSGFEALNCARDAGVDVLVFDHHQTGSDVSPARAFVNPMRQDDVSGLDYLCAAGVVFLAVVAVNRLLREAGWFESSRSEPNLLSLLDLVALGTVCDVAPLVGLNRVLVIKGLQVMRRRANAGLAALADIAKLSTGPDVRALGFTFGPRINAGGRIGRSDLGARLLDIDDPDRAHEIAMTLERLNRERQLLEARALEEATAMADAACSAYGDDMPLILVAGDDWHPGVVGLIASRLKDRFQRPAIAVSFDRNGVGVGSGRSIPTVDLGSAIRACVDAGLLVKGGGHFMAAGLSVEKGRLADVSAFLNEVLRNPVGIARSSDRLILDAVLTAGAVRPELIEAFERGGPFGAGHPEPCFAFPSHRVTGARVIGQGHVSCVLRAGDGASISAIAFRSEQTPLGAFLLDNPDNPVHVAGFLSIDRWGGRKRAQLRIFDAAVPVAK